MAVAQTALKAPESSRTVTLPPEVKLGVQIPPTMLEPGYNTVVFSVAQHASKLTQADLIAEITRRPRRPDSVVQLTPEDMQRVAVHEAGHSLAALRSETGAREVTYVSIIPRMDGSLGFTASMPPQSAVLTRPAVLDRLRTILAGRAAEVVRQDESAERRRRQSTTSRSPPDRDERDLHVGFGDGNLQWTAMLTGTQMQRIDALLKGAYRAAPAVADRAALPRPHRGRAGRSWSSTALPCAGSRRRVRRAADDILRYRIE
jgi:hypothetical protein